MKPRISSYYAIDFLRYISVIFILAYAFRRFLRFRRFAAFLAPFRWAATFRFSYFLWFSPPLIPLSLFSLSYFFRHCFFAAFSLLFIFSLFQLFRRRWCLHFRHDCQSCRHFAISPPAVRWCFHFRWAAEAFASSFSLSPLSLFRFSPDCHYAFIDYDYADFIFDIFATLSFSIFIIHTLADYIFITLIATLPHYYAAAIIDTPPPLLIAATLLLSWLMPPPLLAE